MVIADVMTCCVIVQQASELSRDEDLRVTGEGG